MSKSKYILASIVQTCEACPSQWEGHFDDGIMFYCRYRHGRLTIESSTEPTSNVMEAMENLILDKDMGDSFDGVMDTETLYQIMRESGKFGFTESF